MKPLKLNSKLVLALEIFSLAFCLTASFTDASASAGWTKQPSWASEPRNTASRKPSAHDLSYGHANIAPFTPGSNNLSLDLGQVFLMGDLGSNYADNIGARVHYTFGVSDLFGFDTSLGYSDHSDSKARDGSYSLASLTAGVRSNLSWYDKVIPHANFGMGFYRPSYSIARYAENGKTVLDITDVSALLFGVYLGAGVDLELTRQLFFGATLTFNDVFGNTKVVADGSTLDVGGTFTTFFIRAGVTF